jgi:amidase
MAITATSQLCHLGAGELAALIRDKRASSREVVEAHLERIRAVNAELNALTILLEEQALAAADAADRAIAAGEPIGPLHGVPFTVKENIDLAGSATSQAVAALADADPGQDAPQVASLRVAGAIPLARSNLPDFGLRWHTDNALRGATYNPWDASRTPGGSSGGEAVALATGMTPLGLGNDLGGSLRWPAQCTGIASLKPSLGRVPQATTIEPVDPPVSIQLMAVEGPMARRIADLRLAAELMIQPSWRDPWHVPAPFAGPPLAGPIRVALVTDPAGQGISPQVADGVRKAAAILQEAGYAVEEIEPPRIAEAAQAWSDLLLADIHGVLWPVLSPLVSPGANQFMLTLMERHPDPDRAVVSQAFITRVAILRAWAEFQQTYPLIVAPICTEPPFPVGTDLESAGIERILAAMRMVVTINLLGLPAAAVPVGIEAGLPQVVQVIGQKFREDTCLEAASVIEERLGRVVPIDPREPTAAPLSTSVT